jgi:hypothetical protein
MTERVNPLGNIENRRHMLAVVRDSMQPIIDEAGIPRQYGRIETTPEKLRVFSLGSTLPEENDPEVFRFSSMGYTDGFDLLPEAGKLFFAIEDIRIPQSLREAEIGLGTRIVTAWEQALRDQGIDTVAALGIKNPDARRFWAKLGYQTSKRTFAHMYKKF